MIQTYWWFPTSLRRMRYKKVISFYLHTWVSSQKLVKRMTHKHNIRKIIEGSWWFLDTAFGYYLLSHMLFFSNCLSVHLVGFKGIDVFFKNFAKNFHCVGGTCTFVAASISSYWEESLSYYYDYYSSSSYSFDSF